MLDFSLQLFTIKDIYCTIRETFVLYYSLYIPNRSDVFTHKMLIAVISVKAVDISLKEKKIDDRAT